MTFIFSARMWIVFTVLQSKDTDYLCLNKQPFHTGQNPNSTWLLSTTEKRFQSAFIPRLNDFAVVTGLHRLQWTNAMTCFKVTDCDMETLFHPLWNWQFGLVTDLSHQPKLIHYMTTEWDSSTIFSPERYILWLLNMSSVCSLMIQ